MLIDDLAKAAETMCREFCMFYDRAKPAIYGEYNDESAAALERLCEICETCPMDGLLR